jgi:membrane protease YdiL (CAAX protease family)
VLFALASLAVLWFLILPRNWWTDLAFLAFVTAVSLGRVFPELYAPAAPRLRVDFLGQMMWRRVAILSVLLYRPVPGIDLGFLPARREWLAGLREYLFFAPLGAALSLAIGFVRFQPMSGEPWQLALATAGIFLGMLWFVALTEEFFFRGMLQQWFAEWLSSSRLGLVAASVVFGAAHLGFRYPPLNWRFALVATLAGLFYGRAFQRGGIRAAMVAHALVNLTWRMLFV